MILYHTVKSCLSLPAYKPPRLYAHQSGSRKSLPLIQAPSSLVALNWLKEQFIIVMFYANLSSTLTNCVWIVRRLTSVKAVFLWSCISPVLISRVLRILSPLHWGHTHVNPLGAWNEKLQYVGDRAMYKYLCISWTFWRISCFCWWWKNYKNWKPRKAKANFYKQNKNPQNSNLVEVLIVASVGDGKRPQLHNQF